jgi:ribonuclease-3
MAERAGRDRAGEDAVADLGALADALGHRFADPALLAQAVTHPSLSGLDRPAAEPAPGLAYERLEFLGDRVLGLVIAEWMLERFPAEREGDLAKRHAALVRREALATVAVRLDLGRHLRLSPGESDHGGRANRAILADACEAVIAALYLDAGLPRVKAFIRDAWSGLMAQPSGPPQDPKTALQEWAQARGKPLPVYQTIGQTGRDHAPVFEVRLTVAGLDPVVATGASKRAAEKIAAATLLRGLGALVYD